MGSIEFSQILKKLRDEIGITQTELSKKLEDFNIKTSAQNISYWEKGRQPPFEIVIALSKIFNVSIDYLIGASPYKTRKEELEFGDLIKQSSEEIIDQKIVNTLISLNSVLVALKEATPNYFEDFTRLISISEKYFIEMASISFDIQTEIIELEKTNSDISYEDVKKIILNNNDRFKEIEDIYYMLTKFINSLSVDYKSNIIDNAIADILKSLEQKLKEGSHLK
jgi:transcriptional regulator with XRE-family HTH domain